MLLLIGAEAEQWLFPRPASNLAPAFLFVPPKVLTPGAHFAPSNSTSGCHTALFSRAARFHGAIWRQRSFKVYIGNEPNMDKSVTRLARGSGDQPESDDDSRPCF